MRTRDIHGVELPWGSVRHYGRTNGLTDLTVRRSVGLGHLIVDETGTRLVPVSSPPATPKSSDERFAAEYDLLRTQITRAFVTCPADKLEAVVTELVTDIRAAFGKLLCLRVQRDQGRPTYEQG